MTALCCPLSDTVLSSTRLLNGAAISWKSRLQSTVVLNGAAISWKSRLQSTVALSTAEAEYIALCEAGKEAMYIRQLLEEIGISQPSTVIYEDNQPCLHIAHNPVTSGRTKHVNLRYHWIRQHIKSGAIDVKWCATAEMLADLFTKILPKAQTIKLRTAILGLGVEGECEDD